MKKIALLLLVLPLLFSSCSSDDGTTQDPTPQFAMTAKINGTVFQANSPFGNNKFSTYNIYAAYPIADFVLLQGRQGGVYGNPEINLWLKRTEIAVGTYNFSTDQNNPTSHAIDLIDNSNNEYEDTVSGTITITDVNTTTKIVKGTFEFTCSEIPDQIPPVINMTITEGKFRYQYEEIN